MAGIRMWAAVRTYPQAEHFAAANLRQKGYETWLPLVPIRRRDRVIRTMWHTVEVPAFSRYVLVLHSPNEPWTPIRYTEGVQDLLKMGGKPAHANGEAVDALRAVLDASRTQEANRTEDWPPGAPVRLLMGGPGLDGIVVRSDKRLVTVSVIMLGTLRDITVPTDRIRLRDDG